MTNVVSAISECPVDMWQSLLYYHCRRRLSLAGVQEGHPSLLLNTTIPGPATFWRLRESFLQFNNVTDLSDTVTPLQCHPTFAVIHDSNGDKGFSLSYFTNISTTMIVVKLRGISGVILLIVSQHLFKYPLKTKQNNYQAMYLTTIFSLKVVVLTRIYL